MRGRPRLATLSTLTKIRAAAKGVSAFPNGLRELPGSWSQKFSSEGRSEAHQSAHFAAGTAETESTGTAASMRFFVNARAKSSSAF